MSDSIANFTIEPINVILCDDIRREISGKDILIGVYSGDIIISSVPVIVPIAIYIQVRTKDAGIARIKVKVTDPAGNTAGRTDVEFSAGESSETATAAISLPPLGVSITMPGPIRVYWSSEGGELTLIGEKNVKIGPLPTASLPPSGRSAPAVPPSASAP